MRRSWLKFYMALSVAAASYAAQAESRIYPQQLAASASAGAPMIGGDDLGGHLAPPGINPGSNHVQHLLKLLAARHAHDWANLAKYELANSSQRQLGRPVAVFMGDSITENWVRDDPAFFAVGFINRGISGQTSSHMLLRFMDDVVALRPQVVHIMAGTNDVAGNAGPMTDEEIEENIAAMVDLATANRIRVVLASIPPAKSFPWAPTVSPAQRIRALNQWLHNFAEQRGVGYADYYPLLADVDGGLRSELSGDGVHPQHNGYSVMEAVARESIARALR
jgi:lysophospholipase L1-like esterase